MWEMLYQFLRIPSRGLVNLVAGQIGGRRKGAHKGRPYGLWGSGRGHPQGASLRGWAGTREGGLLAGAGRKLYSGCVISLL